MMLLRRSAFMTVRTRIASAEPMMKLKPQSSGETVLESPGATAASSASIP